MIDCGGEYDRKRIKEDHAFMAGLGCGHEISRRITAILDRFLHDAEAITITGTSYRLRNESGQENTAQPQSAKKEA